MPQPPDDVQYSLGRLLVVDDDPRLLANLCENLRNNGFEVNSAEDGHSALKQIKRHGYDLILLDLHMPRLNGLRLMSRLGKAGVNVPVIVVSGLVSFGTVRRAFRRGAYDYVRKPFVLDELLATVRKALDKHRLEQTRTAVQKCAAVSEAFHRTAMDRLPEIVFGLDPENRFCFLNDKITDLLGYRKDDLIGRPFQDILKEQDGNALFLLDSARLSGVQPETRELRLKILNHPGLNRIFEVTIFPLEARILSPDSGWVPTCFSADVIGIARDVTEQKEAEAFLIFQASHDLLTRLPNRILFRDRLDQARMHAIRNDERFSVMFLDLNRFKEVNDTLGHDAGDRVIHKVAQRLRTSLRAEDTLARFGGDEFILLLPAAQTREHAQTIADKLIESLRTPFTVDEHEVRVGVSIGIAMFPDAGSSTDDLIRSADIAMYFAKSLGEDGYQFYS